MQELVISKSGLYGLFDRILIYRGEVIEQILSIIRTYLLDNIHMVQIFAKP